MVKSTAVTSNYKNKKVLVALSGGVDSSVAAALLQKEGYKVEGAYMQCWSTGPYCTTEKDRADAARVAAYLGIPFHIFNFEKEYKEAVIDYFFSEYKAARTPNPDVMCNKEIKFGLFLKKSMEAGFDYVATGHYARIQNSDLPAGKAGLRIKNAKTGDDQSLEKFKLLAATDPNKDQTLEQYHLLAGIDPDKDQSYFLYTFNQDQLSKCLFPIGDYTKKQVRKIAKEFSLPTADKPDSQGICFIGPVDVADFLREKIKAKEGDVVNPENEVLGKHNGLAFYTIGQREGIRISKRLPHYVIEKRLNSNQLVIAPIGSEKLFGGYLEASSVNWVSEVPKLPAKVEARIRYRQPLVSATIEQVNDKKAKVRFNEPQRAITPGQSIVIYRGEEVIGGAVIDRS